MPRTERARPGLSDGGRSMNTGETRLPACGKVLAPLQGVNRFVSPAQQSDLSPSSNCAHAAEMQAEMCTTCKILHTSRQPSNAATKCHNSTAENSPKRCWISRSDSSRKIQLVLRRRSPFTKCTRPRTAPTSTSGCISTNTSHRSSPRFSSPMCLARSCPGKAALIRDRVRSPHYSCQLDSLVHELSCVRRCAHLHGAILSQVRCPGGRRASVRVAGRPPLGRGGCGAGGAPDGGCSPLFPGRGGGGGAPRCPRGDPSPPPPPPPMPPHFSKFARGARHPPL